MDIKHVEGKKRDKIMLYALSTCVWCKKVKKLLNSLNVDYYYIDVDLLIDAEREKAEEEIAKWNPMVSFPTIVINDKESINGYDEGEIRSKIANE